MSGDLIKIGHPIAFGGFANVWEGPLGGRKSLRQGFEGFPER